MRMLRALLRILVTALVASALVLTAWRPAGAHHGDIHARCVRGQPVVSERPPGMENILVVCVRGLPEFTVMPEVIPTYNPIGAALLLPNPPDFGGWVTVWLNGHPLKTPYDPVRRIQEPGAFLSTAANRVMMPARFFTTAFGGEVQWNQDHRRATLKLRGKVVQIWSGYRYAMVGDQIVALDQPPVIFLDRLFVPVRFLTEAFGAEVQWDHGNRSARVQMPGAQCVDTVYCGEVR